MMVRELDRIARDLMFENAAVIIARRIARASAINAEDTRFRDSDNLGKRSKRGTREDNS